MLEKRKQRENILRVAISSLVQFADYLLQLFVSARCVVYRWRSKQGGRKPIICSVFSQLKIYRSLGKLSFNS